VIGPRIPIPRGRKGPVLKDWPNLTPEQLAAELKRENGCNLGVRLDHYAVLDPDTQAAGSLLDMWEQEGQLPPTVAWRTAAGNIKRLYLRPNELQSPLTIPTIKLQLRTGSGMQDVIPPSYVKDSEKGIDGEYVWLKDQDPESIEPASLPHSIIEYFIKHSNTRKDSKDRANRLNFSLGGRDDSLFYVATVLRNGGMAKEDAGQLIVNLAKTCDPPYPPKDALRKIESAWKKEFSEKNLAAEVREWVLSTSGHFESTQIHKELALSTMSTTPEEARRLNKNLSEILRRLCEEGTIERVGDRRGCFRRIEKDSELIDFANADCSTIFDLRWPAPFHLERLVNVYPKNVIMVAGASNAGKTAILLNLVRENMARHQVHYFSSEMGAEELRLRLEKFGLPITAWRFEARERATNFADAIIPAGVNIIDYLELTDNFYQVGGEIKKIFDRLTTGIAIVAIQKDANKDLGRGGAFTMEKARLYLSMNPGELKVLKAKNWAQPGHNPNGKFFRFKLVDGCRFI
jgi:hypothetical protein